MTALRVTLPRQRGPIAGPLWRRKPGCLRAGAPRSQRVSGQPRRRGSAAQLPSRPLPPPASRGPPASAAAAAAAVAAASAVAAAAAPRSSPSAGVTAGVALAPEDSPMPSRAARIRSAVGGLPAVAAAEVSVARAGAASGSFVARARALQPPRRELRRQQRWWLSPSGRRPAGRAPAARPRPVPLRSGLWSGCCCARE